MSEDAEIKGVIPTYYNMIIGILNGIYIAWDSNNVNLALTRSIKLVSFLPKKIKKQLLPEKERIQKSLSTVEKIKGSNFNAVQVACQAKTRSIALIELDPFVNKITDLLDQEHLLTQSYGIPTKSRSMGELQRTVDLARHEAGA